MSMRHCLLPTLLAWTLLVALYFFPVFSRSRVLAPLDILESLEEPWAKTGRIDVHNAFCYDAVSQYIPYEFAVHQSLRDGGIVGWNPMTHGGTALFENHMLCPGSLRYFFHRFLPFWDAWDIGRMVHYLLAGMGMILLLLETGLSPVASVLGAVCFSFSSQMVVWIHSDVIASGCCWTPWMIWAFLHLNRVMVEIGNGVRRRIRLLSACLIAGLLCGQALRGGFLHTTLFNLSALVLLFLDLFLNPRWNKSILSSSMRHIVFAVSTMVLVLALAISFPWFHAVVPAAIRGGHSLRPHTIAQCVREMPTLLTSFIPTVLGTPQSMDVFKVFGSDFTNIKFAGGTALVLALLAFHTRRAPRLPKVLFAMFLVIPFTPLCKWFYHRCFILSALGLGWLAAWQLDDLSTILFSRNRWRNILRLFEVVCAGWLVASVVMAWQEPSFLPVLQSYVKSHLSSDKMNRAAWMAERAVQFWHESLIWFPKTLVGVASLGLGLVSASCLQPKSRHHSLFRVVVVIASFCELALFGHHVWRAEERPKDSPVSPFPESEWVRRFVSHLGNGTVLFWQPPGRHRFDYMQINAPSACGIRQADGYESVQPMRLTPSNPAAFDPEDFAMAGISHVSCPHGERFPNANAWICQETSPDYDLYINPKFQSIFLATMVDGTRVPIFAEQSSPNHIHFQLPNGVISLYIAMSYHPDWFYRLENQPWQQLQTANNGYFSSEIVFSQALTSPNELELCFSPVNNLPK